ALALWLIARIVTAEHATDATDAAAEGAKKTPVAWLGLGLAMGGLALTRENALVLVVVILAWALLDERNSLRPARRSRFFVPLRTLRPAATFLAGLAIVIGPVAVRNSLVGGGLYVTTSQSGPNFYIGNNPKADGTYASLRFGRGAPEYERQDATEIAER